MSTTTTLAMMPVLPRPGALVLAFAAALAAADFGGMAGGAVLPPWGGALALYALGRWGGGAACPPLATERGTQPRAAARRSQYKFRILIIALIFAARLSSINKVEGFVDSKWCCIFKEATLALSTVTAKLHQAATRDVVASSDLLP